MLRRIEAILRASSKITKVQIVDNDPIDAYNYLFKLRCRLTSGNRLQIRLRATQGKLNYSYQEFSTVPLQRWDNAPHFPHLASFPHHYHSPQGRVLESTLTGDPLRDLPIVLEELEG